MSTALTGSAELIGTPAFVPGRQVSQLAVIGRDGRNLRVVHESAMHIEAPNWTPDGTWLVFNSGGRLFRTAADGSGSPQLIGTDPALFANNDHVLAPDGRTIYFSVDAGDLYAVEWQGGAARRVSNVHPAEQPLRYYLHGISPDGSTLVYVGIAGSGGPGAYGLYAIPAAGGPDVPLLHWGVPVDGPEYSPDGRWIYFNGEDPSRPAGHAQIYRMRPDGSGTEQLTGDDGVNWFPHPSPDGRWVAFLTYPPGTRGHPANRQVVIRMMRPDGQDIGDVVTLLGGQGTINVNSWASDSERLAFVAYPESGAGNAALLRGSV